MSITYEIILHANNSSGVQKLQFETDYINKELNISLFGKINKKNIQVNFDSINILEIENLINYLTFIKNEINNNTITKTIN